MKPTIFWNLEFVYFPKIDSLFIIHNKNPATIGSRMPLVTWANLIISIGFILREENNTPSNKINIQTNIDLSIISGYKEITRDWLSTMSISKSENKYLFSRTFI